MVATYPSPVSWPPCSTGTERRVVCRSRVTDAGPGREPYSCWQTLAGAWETLCRARSWRQCVAPEPSRSIDGPELTTRTQTLVAGGPTATTHEVKVCEGTYEGPEDPTEPDRPLLHPPPPPPGDRAGPTTDGRRGGTYNRRDGREKGHSPTRGGTVTPLFSTPTSSAAWSGVGRSGADTSLPHPLSSAPEGRYVSAEVWVCRNYPD